MQWIVYIITALIIAYIGAVAHALAKDGHYWVFAALPVAGLYLGWVFGNKEDRDEYRRLWRWITGRSRPQ